MMLLRGQLQMWEDLLTDYQLKSRMTGDCHVRFREGLGGKFPRSTRLASAAQTTSQSAPKVYASKHQPTY
jgi:hypothetical protein